MGVALPGGTDCARDVRMGVNSVPVVGADDVDDGLSGGGEICVARGVLSFSFSSSCFALFNSLSLNATVSFRGDDGRFDGTSWSCTGSWMPESCRGSSIGGGVVLVCCFRAMRACLSGERLSTSWSNSGRAS